jgi:hypothetical protein
MRRTPLWVFVAAVGVQLAALSLCLWVMERGRRVVGEDAEPAPAEARAEAEALPPAPPLSPFEMALARNHAASRVPEPVRAPEPQPEPVAYEPEPAAYEPEPVAYEPEPAPLPPQPAPQAAAPAVEPDYVREPPRPRSAVPDPKPVPAPRRVVIRAVQPPAAPVFGPPPERPPQPPADPNSVPRYITEPADETTQVMRGRAPDGPFTFGFYSDGNIRFVDADAGRYAGTLDSARARMREDGGMRAFTVQIGVAADGRLQAAFTGGPHDARTFPLEPLAGWSAA